MLTMLASCIPNMCGVRKVGPGTQSGPPGGPLCPHTNVSSLPPFLKKQAGVFYFQLAYGKLIRDSSTLYNYLSGLRIFAAL